MKRTAAQNKQLYGLLSKLRTDSGTKQALVAQYSNGRTEKSSELTYEEAYELIGALQHESGTQTQRKTNVQKPPEDRENRLRKAVISKVYQLPEKLGFYKSISEKKVFDGVAFDTFMIESKHSPFKGKRLNDLNFNELRKLIAVFGKWIEFYEKSGVGS